MGSPRATQNIETKGINNEGSGDIAFNLERINLQFPSFSELFKQEVPHYFAVPPADKARTNLPPSVFKLFHPLHFAVPPADPVKAAKTSLPPSVFKLFQRVPLRFAAPPAAQVKTQEDNWLSISIFLDLVSLINMLNLCKELRVIGKTEPIVERLYREKINKNQNKHKISIDGSQYNYRNDRSYQAFFHNNINIPSQSVTPDKPDPDKPAKPDNPDYNVYNPGPNGFYMR